MIRSEKKMQTILIAAVLLMAVLVAATAPASANGPLPDLTVNKTVYDPDSGEWVKALAAELQDTLRFNCTITNTGTVNLSQIRFWDVLDCSLQYADGLRINGETKELVYDPTPFKPYVMHPYDPDWNLSEPITESFGLKVCGGGTYNMTITDWEDYDGNFNVSAGDQIELGSHLGWYHVDRMPYTLILENGDERTVNFDSVLDWDDPGMNLTNPNGTEWLEVCGCKDTYKLVNWTDSGCPYLDSGDLVTLRNERTLEEVEYTVEEEVAKDLVVSREHELDKILYSGEGEFILEPGQNVTIEYNVTVVRCGVDNNTFCAKGDSNCSEEGEEWTYSNEDVVTITVPCLDVDKTVWDGTAWVKEFTGQINDTLLFTSTISNIGDYDFTQLRFWDIMDCSLQYQKGSLKIDDKPVQFCDWRYRFKPHVLHPDNSEWDLSHPESERFGELCPENDSFWQIMAWNDTYPFDGNVSACDQLLLDDSGPESVYWFHVDRVPYTLWLYNCGEKYFDSVLDWDEMDLEDLNGTKWLEVCCCKDRYTLLNWTDQACPGFGGEDLVTMRNDRTEEEVVYTVGEVAKDLVVSREYEIEGEGPITLEPGETITIKYNATVVRCGVDNNTFRAKGYYNGSWYYSTEAKVTITVPCAEPSGDATESTGFIKDVYTLTEDVYATGSGFDPGYTGIMDIYIFDDYDWYDGFDIATLPPPYASSLNVPIAANGNVGPIRIWNKGQTFVGEYDMFFDADGDGKYKQGIDAVDNFHDPGLIIIGELPALTPLGIVALLVLLSIVATSTLVRRKKR